MKLKHAPAGREIPSAKTGARKPAAVVAMAAFVLLLAGIFPAPVEAATAPPLGAAEPFAILAGTAITNTGAGTSVVGDVGLYPTTGAAITGLTCAQVDGIIFDWNGAYDGGGAPDTSCRVTDEALLIQAKNDLVAAYNNAAAQAPVTTIPTQLGETTVTPGVYNSSAGEFNITGTLTLDAQDDADAVFIFKTASTLVTASDSTVELTGGAQACNVFWQVGSSATLGTNSDFAGNILALASITVTTGATVDGRLLARDGAVTLDTNTIRLATCEEERILRISKQCQPAGTTGSFAIDVTGGPSDVAMDATLSCGTARSLILEAGNYTITESGDLEGFTTSISCNGGSPVAGTTIDVDLTDNNVTCVIVNTGPDIEEPPTPPAPTPGVGETSIDILNVLVAKIENQVTNNIDVDATAINANDINNTSTSTSNAENTNISANTNTSTNTLANSNESNQDQNNQQSQDQVNENDQRTNVDASPSVSTGGASGTGGSAGAQSGPAAATGTGTGTATQTGSGTQGITPKISPPSTGSAGLAAGSGSSLPFTGLVVLAAAIGLGALRYGRGRS